MAKDAHRDDDRTILDEDLSEEELRARKNKLEGELEEFRSEQKKIKELMGNLGGKQYSKIDLIINTILSAVVVTIFLLEIFTDTLPVFISLEVGVLLVSLKIAWMIHSQYRFNHFQFWMLNSLEFRMNELFKKVNRIEKALNRED